MGMKVVKTRVGILWGRKRQKEALILFYIALTVIIQHMRMHIVFLKINGALNCYSSDDA